MEQKIVFSGGLKGIRRTKPSAFTTFDMFEEARMAVLEAGGLYKLRQPLKSAIDGSTYRSIQNELLTGSGLRQLNSILKKLLIWRRRNH